MEPFHEAPRKRPHPAISNDPSNKRARIASRGEDDYSPGNILEIELQNFMTYSYLISKPGPRLNLVIGPNGTGKSSLVCAIAVGLAGEPQFLGRASSIGDYVKRGEESGWVRISLRGVSPEQTIVITRKINKQNKSEWLLDGAAVSKKEILDVVQGFNIQVNNLTQFLPQDRVCEFAKMTPVQLLEETEKAVGDPELSGQHRFLIEKNDKLRSLEVTVRQHEAHLNELQALNAERERDVERVRQRNHLLKQAESLKKKLPWLIFDSKKKNLVEAKEREKQTRQTLERLARTIVELRAPIEEKKKEKENLEATCKKLSAAKGKIDGKRRQITDKENQMSVQVKSKLGEIEELHTREVHRQERIEKARRELQSAERDLLNLPAFEPPRAEIEMLGAQIHELAFSADEKKRQKQDKESMQAQKKRTLEYCARRLQDIESFATRRLQALKDTGARRIFEAFQWVQDHRRECQMEVYGPVLLEVNLTNKDYGAYLESHVAGYIWKAFITQHPSDRDFLNRNLKQFGVPVIHFTGDADSSRAPSLTNEMREVGIQAKLIDAFTATPVVKEVLRTQAMLDHSFIGTSEANLQADKANLLGVMDLWTPENHYRWQSSRYGGHVSASVTPVRPARLFSHTVDTREQNELQHKKLEAEDAVRSIENEIRQLATEQRQLEDDAAKLHRQREEIVNTVKMEKKRRQDLSNIIVQRQRKLQSIEKEEAVQSAEQRIRLHIHEINKERYKRAVEMKDLLFEAVNTQRLYVVKHLASCELDLKVREMDRAMRTYEKEGAKAQQEHEHSKTELEKSRRAVEAAKEAAEQVARLTPELQRAFAKMPDTVAGLEEAIEESIAEANAVLCLNDNVLEEYEARRKEMAFLSSKLKDEMSTLTKCQEEVDSVKGKWLPTLRGLVSKINTTFSRNFQEMAVAGEVTLDERGNNFNQYGILIKVKFRETGELQVLSAHHQSGGERSVSTILYLVSLQDLTHCPFRVVDEINQGMDPINERKMFQQLVRAASEPNTPQCFLLTPKLLSDLEYTEACSILNIMNGPWIQSPAKAWNTGASWSVVTESLSQASQSSQRMVCSL